MNATPLDQNYQLPVLLRQLRIRLDGTTPALGDFKRLRSRCGKPVSQEELAEAIGVSRGWYASLELGTRRPSIALLARLATALNASYEERARLFAVAIPSLQGCLAIFGRCPNCSLQAQK